MSWTLSEDWLTTVGLTLLTVGTGVQAWTHLADFKEARKAVSKATFDGVMRLIRPGTLLLSFFLIAKVFSLIVNVLTLGGRMLGGRDLDESGPIGEKVSILLGGIAMLLTPLVILLFAPVFIIEGFIRSLSTSQSKIRTEGGGDDALRLAGFFQQTEVWGILMIGSALALVAAIMQLIVDYR